MAETEQTTTARSPSAAMEANGVESPAALSAADSGSGSGNVQQKFDWAQLHSLGDIYDAATIAGGRKEREAAGGGQPLAEEDSADDDLAHPSADVDEVEGPHEPLRQRTEAGAEDSGERRRGGPQRQRSALAASLSLPSPFSPFPSRRLPLVVVASLLSTAANVAGIARSAEVFHVAGLCLSSSSLLADPLFVRISVSSQRWLPLMELPVARLRPQLLEWKALGWTLVALEQTRESVPLPHFSWPRRGGGVILLLGNEREGVPVDLLHLVDEAVEIPQRGVIRSLNVHVAAAIIMHHLASQQRA